MELSGTENNDTDLYGDLENHGMLSDIEKLENELKKVITENEKLRTELKETQGQIECLNNDKVILKNNIVALYNTALQEIERKDKKISELNAQVIERNIKKQRT